MSDSKSIANPEGSTNAPHPRTWLDLPEDAFLADCRFDAFRGPGPGGQKRNKTSNSIRLTHVPTGLHVIAGESRSQVENKARAIRRLRLRIALELRHEIDPLRFEPPAWFKSVTQLGRLAISTHNVHYAQAAALVLDLLSLRHGSVAEVGKLLGVTTTSVVRFLESDHQLWEAANAIRHHAGQGALDRAGSKSGGGEKA
jgi:hypothetical protein